MLQVEIKGKSADHYRAYAAAKMLRRPTIEEHIAIAEKRGSVLPPGSKLRYDSEEVVGEGQVTTAAVSFSAPKDREITRVVFYKGYGDEETVVGALDVNAAGRIEIEFIEPPPSSVGEPVIIEATGS